jgi:hypothetical protein
MSHIIHTVPVQPFEAGSVSSDIKAANELAASMTHEHGTYAGDDFKAPIPNAELVEELCNFLGHEYTKEHERNRNAHWVNEADRPTTLPQVRWNEGFAKRTCVTKDDFLSTIIGTKYALGAYMNEVPRERGESLASYRDRLCLSSGERWDHRFRNIAIVYAHLHRIDTEERLAREAAKAEERQRQRDEAERMRKQREQWERDASPDPEQIEALRAIVDDASEIFRLLALRDKANEAVIALANIYDKERAACVALGRAAPVRTGPGASVEVIRHNPYLDVPKQPRADTAGSKLNRG